MSAAKNMPGYLWWDQHGATVPELQAVARMILAQPGSASICERINSEFEFVKAPELEHSAVSENLEGVNAPHDAVGELYYRQYSQPIPVLCIIRIKINYVLIMYCVFRYPGPYRVDERRRRPRSTRALEARWRRATSQWIPDSAAWTIRRMPPGSSRKREAQRARGP